MGRQYTAPRRNKLLCALLPYNLGKSCAVIVVAGTLNFTVVLWFRLVRSLRLSSGPAPLWSLSLAGAEPAA